MALVQQTLVNFVLSKRILGLLMKQGFGI